MITPTDTTQAILPAPSIGTALDGGLGYYDLLDRDAESYVQVGPVPKAVEGDTVTITLAGVAVKLYSITAADLAGGVFSVPVINARIADAGDGDKVLSYTVTYTQGGGEEHSDPVLVTVKRSVPGGLDPFPDTPHNENLPPVTLSPHPVPADATAVLISVPLWVNAAAGDVMTVSWNGARFFVPPLAEPLPATVSLTLSAAQILDAGIGPTVPVTWGVHDKVANWSAWALSFPANVQIEDPAALTAPHVGDQNRPWTVLDLGQLGSDNVPVFTPVYDGHALDDRVTVHWNGSNATGESLSYTTPAQSMTDDGYTLTFSVPNAQATALAGGNVRVTYTVQPIGGGLLKSSKSAYLSVTEAVDALPVPSVREAANGQLDPDDAEPSAHTVIDVYPGMAAFDTITLIWEGTAGNGTPARYTAERQVSDTNNPVTFPVKQVDVLKFLDGTADIYYQVTPFSRTACGARLVRKLLGRESARLALKIRRAGAEQPLPAPTVDTVTDGFLDPATEEAVIRATYPNIANGDLVTYTWLGSVTTYTSTVKVGSALVVPPAYVERKYIADNIGGEVTASYTVRRGGLDPVLPSQTLVFRITEALPFTIDTSLLQIDGLDVERTRNATGGTLPYIYTSNAPAVVRVPDPARGIIRSVQAGMATITVKDSASGTGSYPVLVIDDTPLPFHIDSSQVNLTGTESYTRNATGGTPPYNYTSNRPTIVVVPNINAGLIRAASDGDAIITASDSAGAYGSYPVHVSGNAPFYIDPSQVNLTGTESNTRNATGGTTPYTYTSSQPGIVVVPNPNSGVIRAVTDGDAIITARDGAGANRSYPVHVSGNALTEDFEAVAPGVISGTIDIGTMKIRPAGASPNVAIVNHASFDAPQITFKCLQFVFGGTGALAIDFPEHFSHVRAGSYISLVSGGFRIQAVGPDTIISDVHYSSPAYLKNWLEFSSPSGEKIISLIVMIDSPTTSGYLMLDNFTFTR